jgi:putative membrane protein
MEYFFIFLKGFAMGAANVIPGVSGGTIAFITGIYERLIDALKSFDLTAIRYLLKFDIAGFCKHVDLAFLAALGIGVVTSVLTLAKLLKYAFVAHPTWVGAFFFGLIFASIFSVGKMVKHWRVTEVLALVVGLAVAISLAFMNQAGENTHAAYLVVCGVASMCSMIIPGISGSFILILMGNYQLIVIDAVNNLRQMNFADSLPILIPVGIGAVLGLVTLSHVLSWLFKRYHDTAVSLITGFVAGSLLIIWPWKTVLKSIIFKGKEKPISWQREFPDIMISDTWIAFAWLALGIALIVLMEKLSSKNSSATTK